MRKSRRLKRIRLQRQSLTERKNGCQYLMCHQPYLTRLYLPLVEEVDPPVVERAVVVVELMVMQAVQVMEVMVLISKQ